jgi:putative transposase
MNEALRKVLKRLHYPLTVMLTCVRWYVAYPLSFRHIEEIMAERGVVVDHATVHRWSLKIVPVLAKGFRHRKRSVGVSWRMDETYIKVRGRWRYLYRAVDRDGDTVDFLLTARRDEAAARRFLKRAIDQHGEPKTITIDKSGANTAAINSYNNDHEAHVALRQCKYLNNIVEQDHRAIKRIARPMLGFKSFRCARILLAGIETMHMIRKGQLAGSNRSIVSAADQFYALAY